MDKNTIVNMVNKSHNIHLLKISMRECDILLNMYHWEASVKEKVRDLHAHMGMGHRWVCPRWQGHC